MQTKIEQLYREAIKELDRIHDKHMNTSIFTDEGKALKKQVGEAGDRVVNLQRAWAIERQSEYEVLGFVEEFWDAETRKGLGEIHMDAPTRPTGSNGLLELTITEPIQLTKKGQLVTIKASKKQPRRICSMIQILCGKKKEVK